MKRTCKQCGDIMEWNPVTWEKHQGICDVCLSGVERRLDGTVVVWELLECDAGCRWSQVKNSINNEKDGDECVFIGCESGHIIHKRGETSHRHEASAWFKNVYIKEAI